MTRSSAPSDPSAAPRVAHVPPQPPRSLAAADGAPAFAHDPIMVAEILDVAAEHPPAHIVDCTVGGGGHAEALLRAHPQARLLGIDRDPAAVAAATARLAAFGARAQVVHGAFADVAELARAHVPGGADFVLADFGVSSHQLDHAARGFSFRGDAPLDMRMDPTRGRSAAELIATIEEDPLTEILGRLGEERYARRIARAIVRERPTTTHALQALVRRHVPPSRERIDPATRTFQGLRMAVNDELGQIDRLLRALPDLLADGGRFVALSFHSLEDRAVKLALREMAQGCICPRTLPVCSCGHTPALELLQRRASRPSDAEVAANPRARSTRMRAAVRCRRADA